MAGTPFGRLVQIYELSFAGFSNANPPFELFVGDTSQIMWGRWIYRENMHSLLSQPWAAWARCCFVVTAGFSPLLVTAVGFSTILVTVGFNTLILFCRAYVWWFSFCPGLVDIDPCFVGLLRLFFFPIFSLPFMMGEGGKGAPTVSWVGQRIGGK